MQPGIFPDFFLHASWQIYIRMVMHVFPGIFLRASFLNMNGFVPMSFLYVSGMHQKRQFYMHANMVV
jgi:hypothetical protein